MATSHLALAAAIAIGVAFASVALGNYGGSAAIFVLFNVCTLALLILTIPKPRAYVYTFLAAFLFLGFWLKVVVQTIWAPGFLEPVGDFANTAEEWDRALIAISSGFSGIIVARLAHLWCIKKRLVGDSSGSTVPEWFVRWRQPVWTLTLILVVVVNAANLQFAFYQIGMNPKLILPLRMHVLLAWLVNIGFALWFAALVWWDYRNDRSSLAAKLVLPMIEAFFSSVSTLSRLVYPLHAGPYWVALYENRGQFSRALLPRHVIKLVASFLCLFVLSIVLVFVFRVLLYYGYLSGLPPSEPLRSHVYRTMEVQMPALIVHRWIGLEGVLTVGASPNRGLTLLLEAVTDSPKLGARSLFQRTAKVPYLSEHPEDFTFLANAGPVAIFLFSGSMTIVFLGMLLIGFIALATEHVARRWTGNPLLLAVSGAALASVATQTTYFYLSCIFLLQMWIAIAFIAFLQRLRLGYEVVRRI